MGGCAESVQLSALLGVREAAWRGPSMGPVWGDVLKVCNCRHFQGSGRRPGGGLQGACMGGCAESVQLSSLLGVREAAWRGSSRGLYGGMC